MSLQVWLPLNGSNSQQGLSSITMSGSPNSWSDGKIGKCASFNGSTSNVIYNNTTDFNYTDNFSWCVWVNTNYTGSTAQYVFTNGRADAGGYGYGLQCTSASSCTVRYGNSSWSVQVTGGIWTHIVFTKIGSTIKIYKNGSLYSTNTFSGTTPTYSDGNGLGIGCFHYTSNIYPFYGSVNDFRIYNHCLSPKEVKEISKALCLHWRLSDSFSANENLLENYVTSGSFGFYNFPSNTVTYSSEPNMPSRYKVSVEITGDVATSGTVGFYFTNATGKYIEKMEIGETYTISMYAKCNENKTYDIVSNPEFLSNVKYIKRPQLSTSWQQLVMCGQYNGNTTSMVAITFYENQKWVKGDILYISSAKIERGDKATGWTPSVVDPLFLQLGGYTSTNTTNNTEPDCSGFGYNGEKTNAITTNTDSPRNNCSYRFNASYITSPIPNTLKPSDAITLSCWVKLDSQISSGELCLFNCYEGGGAGLNINAGRYAMQIYSGGYTSAWATVSDMTVWHHLAGTFDGQYIKSYIDGELVATTPTTAGSVITYNSTTPWEIGGNPNASGGAADSKMVGYVSDARIYATALSADDIKELYDTPVSIADNGTLMTQGEVVEQ